LYQRLYHLCMSREDALSSRFDYLFEPLDDEEPVDDAVDAVSPADDSSDDRRAASSAAPVRMALRPSSLARWGWWP
jgi:hypothetical protein